MATAFAETRRDDALLWMIPLVTPSLKFSCELGLKGEIGETNKIRDGFEMDWIGSR
jgi:hypothetical protein